MFVADVFSCIRVQKTKMRSLVLNKWRTVGIHRAYVGQFVN